MDLNPFASQGSHWFTLRWIDHSVGGSEVEDLFGLDGQHLMGLGCVGIDPGILSELEGLLFRIQYQVLVAVIDLEFPTEQSEDLPAKDITIVQKG